jgi:hypothetical protein
MYENKKPKVFSLDILSIEDEKTKFGEFFSMFFCSIGGFTFEKFKLYLPIPIDSLRLL